MLAVDSTNQFLGLEFQEDFLGSIEQHRPHLQCPRLLQGPVSLDQFCRGHANGRQMRESFFG